MRPLNLKVEHTAHTMAVLAIHMIMTMTMTALSTFTNKLIFMV